MMSRCTVFGPVRPDEQPGGAQPQRQPQRRDRARALGPARLRARAARRDAPRRRSAARCGRAAAAGRPRGSRPSAAARSCGIRPRSSRFATSEVMNTVLPARLRPVTPSRITGSNSRSPTSWMVSSIRRVRLSVRRARSKAGSGRGGGSRRGKRFAPARNARVAAGARGGLCRRPVRAVRASFCWSPVGAHDCSPG